jgi:glycosyltransferase involved in cell wall biosynthesis
MNIHIITRLTRPEHIEKVWQSIERAKVDGIQIHWRIIVDILGDFSLDSSTLRFLKEKSNSIMIEKGDPSTFGYLLINQIIDSIPFEDWFYILDDDNSIHPDFFKRIKEENPKAGFLVFDQLVEGKDFTGLHIREAKMENMKWQGVDVGQLLIHKGSMDNIRFGGNYSADGFFVENLVKRFSNRFKFINKPLTNYNAFQEKKLNRKLPRILLFYNEDVVLKSKNPPYFECKELTVLRLEEFDEKALSEFNPDCIVTIGRRYSQMIKKSFDWTQRWLHFEEYSEEIGEKAYQCAMKYILNRDSSEPLLSIITPTYNTGDKLRRTFESIRSQTYENWEWVIVDDSTDKYTQKLAEEIAKEDSRVTVYQIKPISGGIIGEAKYRAFMLSRGEILMEMDHDDELHPEACEWIVRAYREFPDAGFYYSDCVEIDDAHTSLTYGPDYTWALGYGTYYDFEYNGRSYKAVNQPNINPLSIRHIVAVPNHFRAWRRDVYLKAGSHNRRLSIADDYELVVRTFLHTKFVHIAKPLYFQYYHNENSQNAGPTRADIQRRVRSISVHYNWDIKNRFEELGQEDWAFVDCKWPWQESARRGDAEGLVNYILK